MMTLVTYQIAYVPIVDLVSPEGLLGSLFCSTFMPSNYSYVHSSGKMGFSMNVAHLRGMAGMLEFGDLSEGDITTVYDRKSVFRAFRWLRRNNPLYKGSWPS